MAQGVLKYYLLHEAMQLSRKDRCPVLGLCPRVDPSSPEEGREGKIFSMKQGEKFWVHDNLISYQSNLTHKSEASVPKLTKCNVSLISTVIFSSACQYKDVCSQI